MEGSISQAIYRRSLGYRVDPKADCSKTSAKRILEVHGDSISLLIDYRNERDREVKASLRRKPLAPHQVRWPRGSLVPCA